ncbi:hypothetical protein SPILM97S_05875 [Streptomyces pilosus]
MGMLMSVQGVNGAAMRNTAPVSPHRTRESTVATERRVRARK